MKKVWLVLIALIMVLVLSSCSLGNREIGIDFKQSFDEAYIYGLDGSLIVHGTIRAYRDFNESDVVQVTIGDKTYLTHYVNVVLIRNDGRH